MKKLLSNIAIITFLVLVSICNAQCEGMFVTRSTKIYSTSNQDEIVGYLLQGTAVELLERNEDAALVSINGYEAYVTANALTDEQVASHTHYREIQKDCNVLQDDNAIDQISIPKGKIVKILGRILIFDDTNQMPSLIYFMQYDAVNACIPADAIGENTALYQVDTLLPDAVLKQADLTKIAYAYASTEFAFTMDELLSMETSIKYTDSIRPDVVLFEMNFMPNPDDKEEFYEIVLNAYDGDLLYANFFDHPVG